MSKLQIAVIRLDDTQWHGDWTDCPELLEPDTCYAVGFLVYQDDDKVVLSGVASETGKHAGVCVIPRGAVQEIEEVCLGAV